MKKFWDKLVASGLWLQPCIMLGVLKYLEKTAERFPDKTAVDDSGERELVDSFCNIIFASSGYVE